MSAFLLLLVKVNLAMAAAIILVSLLRRPLRAIFGAPIAYAIWFLVPVAGMASLLPPRAVAPAFAPVMPVHVPAATVSVMGHIAYSALSVTDQLTGQSALVLALPPEPATAMPDPALLLFAAWVLGTVLMTLYLTRLQLRFSAAVRLGQAGPAVLGFLSPRIVTPDSFQECFTPQEQAAILTHERVHLARQDARVNALTALLRCLCWFNPLIHLGARWLRVDQELACDATAVAASVSRRTYAKALLKSQLVVSALPLGCNWPGSQHPLIERIALLKRKPPGTARRLAGVSFVLLAASFAGLGAWAAQPAVAAKSMAARQSGMVLAALPVAALSQTVGELASSGNDVEASKNVRANEAVFAAPVSVEAPRTVSIEAPIGSALAALPQMASGSAPSNIADQTTVPASPDASPEPKDTLAKDILASPATANAAAAAPAASSVATSAPRPRTEGALQCYLGFGSTTCARNDCNGSWGPVERVDYLGTNAVGADIYEVQFMHRNTAYVIAPYLDGKTVHYLIKGVDHYWIKKTVSSRGAPSLIYTRPENSPVVSACAIILPAEAVNYG